MARRTLTSALEFKGIGLHSGEKVSLTLKPAQGGDGYGFMFEGDGTRYLIQNCGHTGDGRGTILTFGPHRVMTVEHLLSSLRGLGIDDITICPGGIEVPLMDGSAIDFARAIQEAGLKELSGEPDTITIATPHYVTDASERKICIALPSDKLRFTYVLEYGDNIIGSQAATIDLTPESFITEIAPCRTFCLYEEIEQMWALGLAKGGTVDTAIVVRGHEVLTPGGLRRPDEFVRHKILDMIGDLSLLGRPVLGHFIGIRAGHAIHQKLVDRINRGLHI